MSDLDALLERLPEAAKDLKLNVKAVLGESSLTPAQTWGTAVACAIAADHPDLQRAITEAARGRVEAAVLDDAVAAASIMGMNNIFYRFRHMVPGYDQIPARLRMQRLGKPATNRVDLELFSLAVSAIHGCETCVRAHEKVVLEGGLSQQQVFDSVRIAAVMHGTAVALRAAG
ncbi:MAG: carboxymuconolactone decarboxylase family protein [Polyangiales bacterium]